MAQRGRPSSAETCRSATTIGAAVALCLRRRGHLGEHWAGLLRWPARRAIASEVARRPPVGRPDLSQRFWAVVGRGIQRADHDTAVLRPVAPRTRAELQRVHRAVVDPRRRAGELRSP